MSSVRISLIEDEVIIRQSLAALIENYPGFELAGVAESVEAFLSDDASAAPDIILLDIGLKGGMSGLAGLRPIKSTYSNVDIIMLTTFDDADRIFKALCGGASAYLTKQAPFAKIVEAIHTGTHDRLLR